MRHQTKSPARRAGTLRVRAGSTRRRAGALGVSTLAIGACLLVACAPLPKSLEAQGQVAIAGPECEAPPATPEAQTVCGLTFVAIGQSVYVLDEITKTMELRVDGTYLTLLSHDQFSPPNIPCHYEVTQGTVSAIAHF